MEKFASSMDGKIDVVKFRGDEERDFIESKFEATGFPTITLVDKDGKVRTRTDEQRVLWMLWGEAERSESRRGEDSRV